MIPPLTDSDPEWNFDMSAAPHGRKLIALNPGNVAVFAVLSSRNLKDFSAWYPLPKVKNAHTTKEQEDAEQEAGRST